MQQGGSRAPTPMALEGANQDRIHAAQGHAGVGIPQGPAIAVPGQRSGNGVRPTALLLDTECKALESFEALMGLGNVASQKESPRKRVLQDTNFLQNLKNYGVKDHEPTRQEAVQGGINRWGYERRVVRYEGNKDKGKYGALLCGNDQDAAVRKAAVGALATLTSASNKTYKKVIEAKQGNDGLPNVLADTKDEIGRRSAVGLQDTVNSCKETAGAVRETQEMEGRYKDEDSLRAEIVKVDKEYKALLSEYSKLTTKQEASSKDPQERGSEKQGPPGAKASKGFQQQEPPGVRE